MTAATFDHQVGKSLEFFVQQPSSVRPPGNQPGLVPPGYKNASFPAQILKIARMTNGSHFAKCDHDA
jgi:hypothetical protein